MVTVILLFSFNVAHKVEDETSNTAYINESHSGLCNHLCKRRRACQPDCVNDVSNLLLSSTSLTFAAMADSENGF